MIIIIIMNILVIYNLNQLFDAVLYYITIIVLYIITIHKLLY